MCNILHICYVISILFKLQYPSMTRFYLIRIHFAYIMVFWGIYHSLEFLVCLDVVVLRYTHLNQDMTWRKCLHKVCYRLCCRISVCYRSANSLGNYKSRMMKVRYLVYVFGEIVVQDIDSLTYIFSPKYCRTLIHLHLFSAQNVSICYICNKVLQIAQDTINACPAYVPVVSLRWNVIFILCFLNNETLFVLHLTLQGHLLILDL